MDNDAKYPIILPKNNKFTEFKVKQCGKLVFHNLVSVKHWTE